MVFSETGIEEDTDEKGVLTGWIDRRYKKFLFEAERMESREAEAFYYGL